MLIKFSSSSNDTVNPSINSPFLFAMECFLSRSNIIAFTLFNITSISLLLPLCIFILHHGLQRWRRSRSTSSSAMSHSDSFTYHLVTMEIFGVFGCLLIICALYTGQVSILAAGIFHLSFTFFGEMFFHILTCLERYLAVVHPITYLSLRTERGIRIRNICIVCVWLLSFSVLIVLQEGGLPLYVLNFFMLISSLTTVSFCSVSVLCVLIRPGPGGQGGVRERADQSKQRAFYTIASILLMLVFRLIWEVVTTVLNITKETLNCEMILVSFWLSLPSRLVLPLLFLLTKEKLKRKCICCKCHRT